VEVDEAIQDERAVKLDFHTGPNQEIQFIGEQPTYLDLSAFPVDASGLRLVFQPKSCVGKMIPEDCTPPDRDEIVGTSEGPWPSFKLV
jgi:hypothetical protein